MIVCSHDFFDEANNYYLNSFFLSWQFPVNTQYNGGPNQNTLSQHKTQQHIAIHHVMLVIMPLNRIHLK